MNKFHLYHGDKYLWDLTFDKWKYKFKLSPDITIDKWNDEYGIIPLDNVSELQQDTLFEQLNIRLPLELRKTQDEKKLIYIRDNYLKVVSDRYQLRP